MGTTMRTARRSIVVFALGLLIVSCGEAPESTEELSSVESAQQGGIGWPASSMARSAILAVAIPAILKEGAKADYKNCNANGCDGIDGVCYEKCYPDYEFMNPFVSRCFHRNGSGKSYDRGRGKMYCYQGITIDPHEMSKQRCVDNGCDYRDGLCYRRCPEGWVASSTEPTSCTKPCPPYYNDTGGTCYKGTHPIHSIIKLPRSDWFMDRGAGRATCANGEPR